MNDLPIYKYIEDLPIKEKFELLASNNDVEGALKILNSDPELLDWFIDQDLDFEFSMEVYSKLMEEAEI